MWVSNQLLDCLTSQFSHPSLIFLFFFPFSAAPQHMAVPGPGAESEPTAVTHAAAAATPGSFNPLRWARDGIRPSTGTEPL